MYSLLSSQLILFTSGKSVSNIQVRLGVHDKTTSPSSELRLNVLDIKQNPGYVSSGKRVKPSHEIKEKDRAIKIEGDREMTTCG